MNCYLCGSENFSTRADQVRDNDNIKVVECNNCGLVTLSSIDHIDDAHYEESKMHEGEPVSIQSWLQETDIDDQRRFDMLKPKIANKTVLDFGCGCGGFLLKAKELASKVEGVELELRLQPFFNEKKINV